MTSVNALQVPILMYHEIGSRSATKSRLAVSPQSFASQLAYLHDAGFNAITAGTLARIMNGSIENPSDRLVVLTFDDGYEDFYSRAMPLLDRYGSLPRCS